jgi:hypothetical protein
MIPSASKRAALARMSPIEELLGWTTEQKRRVTSDASRDRLFAMEHRWKGGKCYCRMCRAKAKRSRRRKQ